MEWKVTKYHGPQRKRTADERKLLVAAIDRAMLADRTRKDGNETLCRNFVSEARRSWSGIIPDGPGKSAKVASSYLHGRNDRKADVISVRTIKHK